MNHCIRFPHHLAQEVAAVDPVRLLYLAVLRQAVQDIHQPSYCQAWEREQLRRDARDFLRSFGVKYEA